MWEVFSFPYDNADKVGLISNVVFASHFTVAHCTAVFIIESWYNVLYDTTKETMIYHEMYIDPHIWNNLTKLIQNFIDTSTGTTSIFYLFIFEKDESEKFSTLGVHSYLFKFQVIYLKLT